MKLKEKEIVIIKEIIANVFGDAKVYLFGSRVDEHKKGGDVDLFVVAKEGTLEQKIKALAKLKRALYKPVDILLHRDFNREIEQEALRGVVL
jgi:predicted nucleotidyltransferase